MKRIFFTVVAALLSVLGVQAAIKLPSVFSNNLVLQQQSRARIWGWASQGARVQVKPSWGQKTYQAVARAGGRWEVEIDTPAASFTPHTLRISGDGSSRLLTGVLVGEVWFCSGQSNMEMPLRGFNGQPVEGSNRAIAYAGSYRSAIRLLTVPKTKADTPQDSVGGAWKECLPENAQEFSAAGFFFAEVLTRLLQVPVGLINCSWGGSRVEGWLPDSILHRYRAIGATQPGEAGQYEYDRAAIMYNGMLHPLAGYTVKGVLWNQGESNVGRHKAYPTLFKAMVAHWRMLWRQAELPFYCVEIPPYSYGNVNGTQAALLREAQHVAARQTPQCGIVCTTDLVYPHEQEDIHASRKREIGERLAFMAAVRSYGVGGIACDSPEFKEMKVEGRKALLTFDHAEGGLTPHGQLAGFEVAGTDRVFRPARVQEDLNTLQVELTAPDETDRICAVRYCFKNFSPGRVCSLRGLPLVPFRTDTWDGAE